MRADEAWTIYLVRKNIDRTLHIDAATEREPPGQRDQEHTGYSKQRCEHTRRRRRRTELAIEKRHTQHERVRKPDLSILN
jgi:hypothetical protein